MTAAPFYSIVIPCHNEELTIGETVSELCKSFKGELDVEIVLIDNVSKDKTWDALQKLELKFQKVRSFQSPQKPGYGVAIKAGIEKARGSHLVFVMADGSESPNDVVRFVAHSREFPDDCIFGDRFQYPSSISGYPPFKLIVSRLANFLLSYLFKTKSRDLTNGFKLFPRCVVEKLNLKADDFSITLELSLGAVCTKAGIRTLANGWNGRKAGDSSFSLFSLMPAYLSAAIRASKLCGTIRKIH
jgi:dolichol-phosphate mannosyltransferase